MSREKRKQQGPSWQCWICRHKYPAEGFGANKQKVQEVYSLCVKPGHWRCCTACRQALQIYKVRKHIPADTAEQKCTTCLMSQIISLFQEGSTECDACVLLSSFQMFPCSRCADWKAGTEVFQLTSDPDKYCCFKCSPELCLIECTVCLTTRPSTDVRGHPRHLQQQSIRRCTQCRTCHLCQNKFEDARHMICNKNECVTCAATFTCYTCKVRVKSKGRSASIKTY